MIVWDERVAGWLLGKADELREAGVVELFQGLVGRTWRRNVEGFDESAGDTATSLGVTQAENLRELSLREFRDHRALWVGRGVEVSAPDQSLLVNAAGLALHPMKARNNTQQDPAWAATRWSEQSEVRHDAARDNRARYTPVFEPTLPDMESLGARDPGTMSHAMVVYCGGLRTGRTAGWLAVPSADKDGAERHLPWMAAARLWWDEGDLQGKASHPDSTPSPTRFDSQPAPEAPVTLKPARPARPASST